jgi:hypothetical protein
VNMQTTTISTITGAGTTWNGGYCPTCGCRWLGSHYCTQDDILRRIGELMELLKTTGPARNTDRMSTCPCRPENGGSGVCGCILGGPTVTCS